MTKCIWPGCQHDEQPTLRLCRRHWFQIAPMERAKIGRGEKSDAEIIDWIKTHRGGSIVPRLQAIRRAAAAQRRNRP